jgi:hypothetical protein
VKIVFSELDVKYKSIVNERILFEPEEIVYSSRKLRLWIVSEDRLMTDDEQLEYENRKVEEILFDHRLPDDVKIDFTRLMMRGGLNYIMYEKYRVVYPEA